MLRGSPEQSENEKSRKYWSAEFLTKAFGLSDDVTSAGCAMEIFCAIANSVAERTTTKDAETSILRLSTLRFAILIATY